MEVNVNLGYKNYLVQILVFMKCLQTNNTAISVEEQRRGTHIALISTADEIRNLGMRILSAERYEKSLGKIIPCSKLTAKKDSTKRFI